MKKSLKYVALVGVGLLVLGTLLSLCGFFTGGTPWIYADRTGVHVGDAGAKEFRISEKLTAFQELKVDVGMADVHVVVGDRFAVDIQYDGSYSEPFYALEKGVLRIVDKNPGESSGVWQILNFNLSGINGGSNRVTVTVPATAKLRQMELRSDLGDIQCGFGAENMVLYTSLGRIRLKDVQAGQVVMTADNGACEIDGLTADSLELRDNLGSAKLEKVQCAAFTARIDNGALTVRDSCLGKADVKNSLGKVSFEQVSTDGLEVQCDNGNMELAGSFAGESRLVNNLGSIKVTTGLSRDSYRYEMTLDLGGAYVNGDQVKGGDLYGGPDSAPNRLEIQADLGSVWLNFSK